MNSIMLETSQMLENHPLLIEKESYVVPVSSYAAYLAKMNIFSEPLDADEQDPR